MPTDPAQRVADAARELHAEMVALQVLIVHAPPECLADAGPVVAAADAAERAAGAVRRARRSLAGRLRAGRLACDAAAWLLAAVVVALCLAYFGAWVSLLPLIR